MKTEATSKNIEALDLIAAALSKRKLRGVISLDPVTGLHTRPRYTDASALLKRIAAMHGLRLSMEDGAPVMVEDEAPPPQAPQKTKGRPPRTALTPFEEQVGKHFSQMSLEEFAKLLDDAKVPLSQKLHERSLRGGCKEVRYWRDAVKNRSGVRHDVQKLINNAHRKYLRVHPLA